MRFSIATGLSLLIATSPSFAATPTAAQKLAQDAIIVDTHIDAPSELLKHWDDLGVAAPGKEFDYPKARQGGLDVAFMSIYTSPEEDAEGKAWQIANTQIDAVEAMVGRHPDKFAVLRSPGDLERLRAGGRVTLALGMENGAPIGDDLAKIAQFHARGVRYITLAHSANNRISDSSYTVDVSHLSDDAVRDVLRVTDVPVIASHSSMRHFTPGFERNISDELARAVAAEGGVVQLAFGTAFVSPKAAADLQAFFAAEAEFDRANASAAAAGKPTRSKDDFEKEWKAAHPVPVVHIDAVLDQIDYAVKTIGIDHVGMGSDFDGVSGNLPVELHSVADYPNLVAGLQARGYKEADIRKILGRNLLRVWNAVEAAAAH
jgi:membrane dipeptidase